MYHTSANDVKAQVHAARYLIGKPKTARLPAMEDEQMPDLRTDKKQSKVSQVHQQEAKLLRKIWVAREELRRDSGAATQEQFGAKYDIGNQAAVGFFLKAMTPLSLKAALGFATGLRCRIADFSPRLAKYVDDYDQAIGADRQEREILDALRRLTPLQRERIMGMIEAWGGWGQ